MKRFASLKLISSMTIFGTIGLAVRWLPLSRGMTASLRGFIGCAVILLFMLAVRKRPDVKAIKRNLFPLLLSGAFIGVNWIMLFEAYSFTTVATATLCYYVAPAFVILASPTVLGEKISLKKGICVLGALLGMFFVSGLVGGDLPASYELLGVALALGAALFYAAITLVNKKMTDISSYDTAVVQLFVAATIILPYSLIAEDNSGITVDFRLIILVLAIGAIHTGLAYVLYFSSVGELEAGSLAALSYIDPLVAIFVSLIILGEPMEWSGWVGALLILISTLISQTESLPWLSRLLQKGYASKKSIK